MEHITLKDVKEAYERIGKHLPPTPLTSSYYLSNKHGLNIHLKMENLNLSGSFKIRGATNALLLADQKIIKEKGVVAASAGNHAQGVARTSNLLGVKATIFMPEGAPLVKVEKTKNLGANVVLKGASFDETEQAAIEWNKNEGAFWVHPFSDPRVIAGQGTIALEIFDQMDPKTVGAVIIPIGGGGLISGLACAIKETNPDIYVIGVQAKLYNSISKKFNDSSEVKLDTKGQSIADGIAVKKVNDYTYSHIEKYVDEIWSVGEDEIAAGIMELMERDHILAEGAGAVSVAAIEYFAKSLKEKIGDKPVISIISGGNIDVSLLNRITKKGLLYSGRIMRLKVSLDDRPGELVNLLSKISETGANLYNIEHNRVFTAYGVKNADVDIDLETTNLEHQERIKKVLTESGYALR